MVILDEIIHKIWFDPIKYIQFPILTFDDNIKFSLLFSPCDGNIVKYLNFMCHISCVMCHVSNVLCHMSSVHVMCHLSLKPTATDPPPANSPTMNSRLILRDPKNTKKIQNATNHQDLPKIKLSSS